MSKENKTQIDLMREYVRVSDMCTAYNKEHCGNVNPWDCVKLSLDGENLFCFYDHPKFIEGFADYKFAIAILEGKPVFVGDKIYSKSTFFPFDWDDPDYKTQINFKLSSGGSPWTWTWTLTTPKRTFMLNGVELPCPVKKPDGEYLTRVSGYEFYFTSYQDRNKVDDVLYNLLIAARDKE